MVLAYGRRPAAAIPAETVIRLASAIPTLRYCAGNAAPNPVSSPPMSESTQKIRGSAAASSCSVSR
jgi:hypothetical protein